MWFGLGGGTGWRAARPRGARHGPAAPRTGSGRPPPHTATASPLPAPPAPCRSPGPAPAPPLAAPSRPCCSPSRSPSRGHGRPLPASASGSWRHRHRTPAAPGPHQPAWHPPRAGAPRAVWGWRTMPGRQGGQEGPAVSHVPLHDGLPCTRACRDVPARAGLGVGAMPSPHDPTPPPPAPVRVWHRARRWRGSGVPRRGAGGGRDSSVGGPAPAPAPAPFLQPYLGQDGPRGSPSPPCRRHVPVLPLEHRCCRAGEAQGKGSGIHPGARPRPPGKAWPGRHCLPSHPPASSTPAGPGNKRCLSLRSPPLRAAAGPPPRTRLCRERGGPAAAGAHGLCRGPVRAGGQGVAPLCHPHAGRTQIHSVAPLGTAQLRVASWPPGRHGTARKGTAQQGMARHGLPAAAHTDTPWVSSPQGVTGAPAGSPQGPQPGGGRPHGPAGSSVLGQSLPAPGPAHLADNGTPREKYLRTPGKTKGPVTAAGRASRPLPGQPLPGSLLCAPRVPPPKSCPGWGAVAQLPAPPTHRGEEGKAQTLGAWTPTRPLICCVPKHCTSRGGAQHPPTKPLPTVNPGLGPLGGPPGLNPRSLRPPAPRAGSSPPGSSSPGHGLASPQEPAPRGSPAGGYL